MKWKATLAGFILGLCLLAFLFQHDFKPKKMNLLIVSACSLRWDLINPYNKEEILTPNLNRLSQQSFVFENAFSDVSWSNVSGFLSRITKEHFEKNGYKALGRPWKEEEQKLQKIPDGAPTYYFRSPEVHGDPVPVKGYLDDLKVMKKQITDRKNWPFVLEFHSKFMHLPYKSPALEDVYSVPSEQEQKETAYARSRIQSFLANPKKAPEAIFIAILLGAGHYFTEKTLKSLPVRFDRALIAELIQKKNPLFMGILNNTELLALWKKSPFFAKDMETIKFFYKRRLRFFDKMMTKIINGFGDKELMENTVVIFTGDHGEAFGEHGFVGHGETTYDEMIHFPLFIRFPGNTEAKPISKQFYQGTLAKIVEKVMDGSLRGDNFSSFIDKSDSDEFIFSRNCSANTISIRHKNEWKLMIDLADGKKRLFHLTDDPAESNEVSEKFPDQVSRLEEFWLNHGNEWVQNRMLHQCNVLQLN